MELITIEIERKSSKNKKSGGQNTKWIALCALPLIKNET